MDNAWLLTPSPSALCSASLHVPNFQPTLPSPPSRCETLLSCYVFPVPPCPPRTNRLSSLCPRLILLPRPLPPQVGPESMGDPPDHPRFLPFTLALLLSPTPPASFDSLTLLSSFSFRFRPPSSSPNVLAFQTHHLTLICHPHLVRTRPTPHLADTPFPLPTNRHSAFLLARPSCFDPVPLRPSPPILFPTSQSSSHNQPSTGVVLGSLPRHNNSRLSSSDDLLTHSLDLPVCSVPATLNLPPEPNPRHGHLLSLPRLQASGLFTFCSTG
ncbi:hypothetical protein OF83DRAFT_821556 [Amylostereum chailletii]|nr:hypothetical protein OF83DRAFT_821556 [Amylostereum chailletii]